MDREALLIRLHPAIMGKEIAVPSGGIALGRDRAACDVVVPDDGVSRRHCRIYPRDGSVWVEDLGSINGTFVNGIRVSAHRLRDGDIIGFADPAVHHFRFEAQRSLDGWTERHLPPARKWTIGRDASNTLQLAFDTTASSRHATICLEGATSLRIVDEGSTNGTWLDGERVRKARLKPSGRVLIGASEYQFRLEPDGGLIVRQRDVAGSIAVECVGLTRRAGSRKLLEAITLSLRPGEFVGILGPSGAGKSTFLKALNGSEPAQEGTVLFNEVSLYPMYDSFRRQIGYVPQDDIVYPELSVRASIACAARLRLPAGTTDEELDELVESTIELLGLARVADSAVAVLSGGQRKRVCIGCELVMRPGILFLDEPTAGLDPSTEERLMRYFRDLSTGGTACLMTTHILYNLRLFDRIIILSRGRLVFLGTPEEALQHFGEEDPLSGHLPIFDLLEGVSDRPGAPRGSLLEIAEVYERRYRESPLYARHVTSQLSATARGLSAGTADLSGHVARARRWPPFSPRTSLILARRHLALRFAGWQKVMMYLVVPLVLALATLLLPPPERVSIDERLNEIGRLRDAIEKVRGAGPLLNEIFEQAGDPAGNVYRLMRENVGELPIPLGTILMMVMAPIFMGTLTSCLEVSGERPIFRRERLVGQRVTDYLVSKLPALGIVSLLMSSVYLGVCMIRPEYRYFDITLALLTCTTLTMASCCLGLLISALDPTRGHYSVMLSILVILPQLIVSGGIGPSYLDGMGPLLRGVAASAPSRWGLEMMLTAAYGDAGWPAREVRSSMGFDCGGWVIPRGVGVLTGLSVCFLVAAGLVLRTGDVKRRTK